MTAEILGLDLPIVIVIAVVVLFGSSQIPRLARSLGSAQSEFKKGLAEGQAESQAKDAQGATKTEGTNTGTAS